jgi:hypothetical protein
MKGKQPLFIFTLKRNENYRSKTKQNKKYRSETKRKEKHGSEKKNFRSEKKSNHLCDCLLRSETKNWKQFKEKEAKN